MSLFIAMLSFDETGMLSFDETGMLIASAKRSIIAVTAITGLSGYAWLRLIGRA